jgi:cytochrome c-type biogenesis protein CcmH/NrfG
MLAIPGLVLSKSVSEATAETVVAIEQHIVAREFEQATRLLSQDDIPAFQRDYLLGWLAVKQQDYKQAKAIWLPLWEGHPDKL